MSNGNSPAHRERHRLDQAERRAIAVETDAAAFGQAVRVALYLADRTGAPAEDVDDLVRLVDRADKRYRAICAGDVPRAA